MASNKVNEADNTALKSASQASVKAQMETDDFGLPIRRMNTFANVASSTPATSVETQISSSASDPTNATKKKNPEDGGKNSDNVQNAILVDPTRAVLSEAADVTPRAQTPVQGAKEELTSFDPAPKASPALEIVSKQGAENPTAEVDRADLIAKESIQSSRHVKPDEGTTPTAPEHTSQTVTNHHQDISNMSAASVGSGPNTNLSEFSHQQLSTHQEDELEDDDGGWQTMPAFAPYDMYDDDNRLIARERTDEGDDKYTYGGLGGAGKGYTRVIMDDDAESVTSMDDNTKYLFKDFGGTGLADDEGRDAVSQMQATKDLLTEGQRIAYVGVVRLEIAKLVKESGELEITRKTKKEVTTSTEAVKMWGQKMMIRLYAHMDISEAEQLMIEQLAEHGVMPKDLTPALHANSRVHNPMAEDRKSGDGSARSTSTTPFMLRSSEDEMPAEELPPPYESLDHGELPEVQTPSQLPTTEKIDIDLRWTVLCDLFLILIADSMYDARSRLLLERVAASLEISWIDICRFEKRVTDALEMQQAAEKENWNEEEHMESRRKMALKKRYMMMGLATVGGGLVIGLSAGLLAPVIGAGLAAGFTTIGVTGTSSFLAGAGGAAVITSSAAASGSLIGGRAADRRTGAVKTFEYRPLHNNKRVNLIVTVSGWLTGKVDDVRLPFSTVDPIMGDIYSILWEPEMLRSMGDTINILATEALTQGLQQILGSTILVSLMAALQLPIVLTKLSYLIDNPWAVSLDRATAAGLILADSLMDRSLGTRPITLVGYSIGARVIFSCLQELSKHGAHGLVQNVYLFGSPIVVKKDEFLRARTVVAGRFVNGYNRNDWILGYLFRLTNGGIRRVAGLAPVEEVPWLENMDVTEQVAGHMQYRTAMPVLLKKCDWIVESEEFNEIEDPDPENHDERQRELINEIEEARKELEREGKKKSGKRFSIFGRRKKGERQEWEVYEETASKDASKDGRDGIAKLEDKNGNNHGVLFDIDAIRAELAKESYDNTDTETALQIKEIKSTLPPMKLDVPPVTSQWSSAARAGQGSLRETKTAENMLTISDSGLRSTNTSQRKLSTYHTDAYEEELEMTFDTSFDDTSHIYTAAPTNGGNSLGRPEEVRTSQTLPNIAISDSWADIDDEDFGKENEISMTFA